MSALSDIIARLEAGESGRGLDLMIWNATNPDFAWRGEARNGLPKYTTSLDAAVTLVPEGWFWQATRKFIFEGVVWSPEREGAFYGHVQTGPALALCIAALKARLA